jgi:ubiquinone/menaquinone biosynthesis C-methylase UbiE
MRLEQILEQYLPKSGSGLRALDVGCGTGHHLRDLAARGFELAGVDGSADMLSAARANCPDADLLEADVTRLPFEADSFDLALCIEVLRYLPDPEACISEMARVLRPGGVCLATAAPRFSINGYALVNRLAVTVPVGELVRLKQFFTTPKQLARRFHAAGFSAVEVRSVYTGPINWVEHLVPGRLPAFLRGWEGIDRRLADQPKLRGLSNMLLVHAVRA